MYTSNGFMPLHSRTHTSLAFLQQSLLGLLVLCLSPWRTYSAIPDYRRATPINIRWVVVRDTQLVPDCLSKLDQPFSLLSLNQLHSSFQTEVQSLLNQQRELYL